MPLLYIYFVKSMALDNRRYADKWTSVHVDEAKA